MKDLNSFQDQVERADVFEGGMTYIHFLMFKFKSFKFSQGGKSQGLCVENRKKY